MSDSGPCNICTIETTRVVRISCVFAGFLCEALLCQAKWLEATDCLKRRWGVRDGKVVVIYDEHRGRPRKVNDVRR